MGDERSGRRVRRLACCLVLAGVLTTACLGDAGDPAADDDAGPTSGATTNPPAPAPTPSDEPTGHASPTEAGTPTPTPETGPITVAVAGDLHFEGGLRSLLDDPDTALEPVEPYLSEADLTIVNLESAVGTGGTPEPKRYTFQAPPAAFDALAAAGVDVVTMANNHAMDFGPDGFAETIDAVERAADGDPPLDVVGVGADIDEAFAPVLHEVRGTRVAVLGAATPDDPTADPTEQWAADADTPGIAVALDADPLLDAVEEAAETADVVIVYMHWGIQGDSCPSDSQQDLASALAEAGADVVVGSHTHRLQGAGLLGDTYVAYGLGNFVWYTQSSEATSTTGVLTLTVEDGAVVQESWAPARIGSGGLPEFAGGGTAERMRDAFDDLRDCTDLDPLGG